MKGQNESRTLVIGEGTPAVAFPRRLPAHEMGHVVMPPTEEHAGEAAQGHDPDDRRDRDEERHQHALQAIIVAPFVVRPSL